MGHQRRRRGHGQVDRAAEQVGNGRPGALVRNVRDPGAGHLVQQFGRHVLQRTVARGRIVELVRVGLGVRHQFLQRLDRQVLAHHQHLRRRQDIGHRREVLDRIPRQVLHQQRRDHVEARVLQHQRVAVRLGARHQLRGDAAVAAGPVVDHDRLAECPGQRLRNHPGRDVGGAACRGGYHQRDRAAGIGVLRQRGRRQPRGTESGQRGSDGLAPGGKGGRGGLGGVALKGLFHEGLHLYCQCLVVVRVRH
ncbi:hypothetical protein D9M70_495390 [compost metagenome]